MYEGEIVGGPRAMMQEVDEMLLDKVDDRLHLVEGKQVNHM